NGRRYRARCSSVPNDNSTGPTMPTVDATNPALTAWRACSRAKNAASSGVPPRPPYSAGHAIPAHPASNSSRCHSRPASNCWRSFATASRRARIAGAWASSHAVAAAQNSASSVTACLRDRVVTRGDEVVAARVAGESHRHLVHHVAEAELGVGVGPADRTARAEVPERIWSAQRHQRRGRDEPERELQVEIHEHLVGA